MYVVITSIRVGNPYSGIPQMHVEAFGPFTSKTAAEKYASALSAGGNVVAIQAPKQT